MEYDTKIDLKIVHKNINKIVVVDRIENDPLIYMQIVDQFNHLFGSLNVVTIYNVWSRWKDVHSE